MLTKPTIVLRTLKKNLELNCFDRDVNYLEIKEVFASD